MTPRLITTPASHYCEKARWALDRAGVAYVEERHAPLFTRLATARVRAPGTVPVLVCDDGVLRDSTDILRWVDRRMPLYPEGAAELEDRLDEGLGRAARVVAFHHIAGNKRLAVRIATAGVPRWERALATACFGVARRTLSRMYGVRPEALAPAVAEVRRAFDDAGARLADGRPFLCGDRLSAADITFAALGNLVILASGGGAASIELGEAPPEAAALITALRATPAGHFVLRMHAEERWPAGTRRSVA